MIKLITTLCLLTAIGMGFAPSNVLNWMRTAIRDGFQPGVHFAATTQQSAARQLRQRLVGDDEQELQSQISNLKSQFAVSQKQLRRERLAHQRTRDRKLLALQRHDDARKPLDPPPLIVPQVVAANVLGDELAAGLKWFRTRPLPGRLICAGIILRELADVGDQGVE